MYALLFTSWVHALEYGICLIVACLKFTKSLFMKIFPFGIFVASLSVELL